MTKKQTSKPRAGRARRTTTKGTQGTKRQAAKPRKRSKRAASATGRPRDPGIPAPGTIITRRYKGRDLRLTVLDEGFRFEGTVYRSLTAAALKATGYSAISGPHFWKLDGAAQPSTATAEPIATAPETAAD